MSRRGLVAAVISCSLVGFFMWLVALHRDIAKLLIIIGCYIVLFALVSGIAYSVASSWQSRWRRK